MVDPYVVLADGRIGRIAKICDCDQCSDRGELELYIADLQSNYLECLKHHELFDKVIVLNLGNSLDEMSSGRNEAAINKVVAQLYHDFIVQKKGR